MNTAAWVLFGMLSLSPSGLTPDDPLYAQQWAPQKIGLADVWSSLSGGKTVVVADIDTGVDCAHEDLQGHLWSGKAGTCGYDIASSQPGVSDQDGHGTHVAGILGAVSNNGVGIVGTAQNVTVLPIAIPDTAAADVLAQAVEFAISAGAQVINFSWSFPESSDPALPKLFSAIADAKAKNILFVIASGNYGLDLDNFPDEPLYQAPDNVVMVAATDEQDQFYTDPTTNGYSNFGRHTVDLAAPGQDILSTLPGSKYGLLSGTSMAAPMISAAAAALWSKNPGWTYTDVKNRLLQSVDVVPQLRWNLRSGGRLNLARAIQGPLNPVVPVPADNQWVSVPESIQSDHPYAAGAHGSWTLQPPQGTPAKWMKVHFTKIDLEPYSGEDAVELKDSAGYLIERVPETALDGLWTEPFPVDSLDIEFTSGSAGGGHWGFAIDQFEYAD